mgnify:CR=1 FL=1
MCARVRARVVSLARRAHGCGYARGLERVRTLYALVYALRTNVLPWLAGLVPTRGYLAANRAPLGRYFHQVESYQATRKNPPRVNRDGLVMVRGWLLQAATYHRDNVANKVPQKQDTTEEHDGPKCEQSIGRCWHYATPDHSRAMLPATDSTAAIQRAGTRDSCNLVTAFTTSATVSPGSAL